MRWLMRSDLSRVSRLMPPDRSRWPRPPGRPFRRRSRWHVRVRRTPTWVLLGLALLTVLGGASMLGDEEADPGDLAGTTEIEPGAVLEGRRPATGARADRSGRDEAGASRAATDALPVFARYEEVTLRLPTGEPLGVHFTEGRRVGAVPLRPRGTLTANANPQSFDADRVDEAADGPEFAVAAAADRGRPATSAAVVSVDAGRWVRAPVSGEVAETSEYPTADGTDWRVVLTPASRPALHVTVTGLHHPSVESGDVVESGEVLAAPRLVDDNIAQVAIEVGPAGAPTTLEVDEARR